MQAEFAGHGENNQPLRERLIERFTKLDLKRLVRGGSGQSELPLCGVDWSAVFCGNSEAVTVCGDEQLPGSIGPGSIYDQRVCLAWKERRAICLARQNPALDAARIKEDRQPAMLRIPEFLIDFEKRKIDGVALAV